MDEITAQQTITAHAVCTIVDDCDLCPFYNSEIGLKEQQEVCQESITTEKVRETLTVLRGNIE